MAKLIIQLMNEEWTVDLQVGSNVLGRASTCTVPLKDASLSRQHCDIVYVGGQATVVDKGSLNGTLVNGRKITEHKLEPGDKIVIGASTVWFERKNVAMEKKAPSKGPDPRPATAEVRRPAAAPESGAAPSASTRRAATAATPSRPSSSPRLPVPQAALAESLKDFVYRGRSGASVLKIAIVAVVLVAAGVGAYLAKDLLASAPTVEIDKDNLIKNGTFEGMSGKPDGWVARGASILGPADRAASALTVDSAQGHNGGPCLVLEKAASELVAEGSCTQAFPVGGRGAAVRAEAWARADGFGGRVALKIDWLRGMNGPVIAEEFSEPPLVGASTWTKMGATFAPPAGAGAFRVALAAVGRAGRIFFDDVLVKVEGGGAAPVEKKLGSHRASLSKQGILSLALRARSTSLLNVGVRLESDKEGTSSQAFATDVKIEEKEEGLLRFVGKLLHPADLREIEFEGGVQAVQGGTGVYYKFKPEALRQIDRVTIVMTLPRADGIQGIPERPEEGTSRISFLTDEGDAVIQYSDLARLRAKKMEGRLRLAQSFPVDASATDEVGFGFNVLERGAGAGSLNPADEAADARKKGQLGQALSLLRGLVKTVKENQAREKMEQEIRGLEESEKRDWADVQSQAFQARLTQRADHVTRAQSAFERYLVAWTGEGSEDKARQLRDEMEKELKRAPDGEAERPRRILERARKCAEAGKKVLAQTMLQTLLARYPQSDSVSDAQKLLKDLEQ